MADDITTTGQGDASKGAPLGVPGQDAKKEAIGSRLMASLHLKKEAGASAEPVILEETVTKPHATPAAPAPAPAALKKPAMPVPPPVATPSIPRAPVPPPAPAMPAIPKHEPAPVADIPEAHIHVAADAPLPKIETAASARPPITNPTPAPKRTPEPSIPPVASAPRSAPATPAAPAAPAAPQPAQADFAKILSGVKLPERRSDPLAAQAKPATQFEVKQYDTALSADVRAAEEAAHANAPAPAAKPAEQPMIEAVHTLKDDLQQVVHDQNITAVRAATLEEEKRHRQRAEEPEIATARTQGSRRMFAILFSVVLLLLLGGGALWGVFAVEQAQQTAGTKPLAPSSILFAENTVAFPLGSQSASALKQTLAQARTASTAPLGSITRIVPTIATTNADGTTGSRPATFAEFMQAIGAHPSDELLRALSPDFFFGIYTVDTNAPILVIPVTSYDHAFAGMLNWEPTLNADLSPVFTALPPQTTGPNGLPTTRSFQDVVMRNYDVRALEDDSGSIMTYYSFPTQNVLIIAENAHTFPEILSRLQANRQL